MSTFELCARAWVVNDGGIAILVAPPPKRVERRPPSCARGTQPPRTGSMRRYRDIGRPRPVVLELDPRIARERAVWL
jgi:hypothetical protein